MGVCARASVCGFVRGYVRGCVCESARARVGASWRVSGRMRWCSARVHVCGCACMLVDACACACMLVGACTCVYQLLNTLFPCLFPCTENGSAYGTNIRVTLSVTANLL